MLEKILPPSEIAMALQTLDLQNQSAVYQPPSTREAAAFEKNTLIHYQSTNE